MNGIQSVLQLLQEINVISVAVRIVLATGVGACIGMDRGRHGRAAGIRTHILVCLGAAITTLLGFYTASCLHYANDPLRVGAQVISGIGFLGVGTIVIRGHSQVMGLTTAAGLWATACIGLAIGAGFYSAALLSFLAVIVTMTVISRFERRLKHRDTGAYYIELTDIRWAKELYERLDEQLTGVEIVPAKSGLPRHVGMELIVKRSELRETLLDELQQNEHVAIALPHRS